MLLHIVLSEIEHSSIHTETFEHIYQSTNNNDVSVFHFLDGFNSYAEFQEKNGRMYLVHDGHIYRKTMEYFNKRYWLCQSYNTTGCKARVISQRINGREMVKIKSSIHSHVKQIEQKHKSEAAPKPKIKSGQELDIEFISMD